MTLLVTRSELEPLFHDETWIQESLRVIEDALLSNERSQASWLYMPLGKDERVSVQVKTGETGGYVRVFPDRYGGTRRDRGHCGIVLGPDGATLAMMQMEDLEIWRTCAPVALAVKYFAPPRAATLGIIGSGEQAKTFLRLARLVIPTLQSIRVFSRTPAHREHFAEEARAQTGLPCVAAGTVEEAVKGCDVVFVAAPQTKLERPWIRAGALVASILPLDLDVRRAAPDVTGPEVRSSGWDPPFGVPKPLGPAARQPNVTLVEVLRGVHAPRSQEGEIVAYEQLGTFRWDLPLVQWAYEWARENGVGRDISGR